MVKYFHIRKTKLIIIYNLLKLNNNYNLIYLVKIWHFLNFK